MSHHYQTPDLAHTAFAKTNAQTITQRIQLVQELLPATRAIGELWFSRRLADDWIVRESRG